MGIGWAYNSARTQKMLDSLDIIFLNDIREQCEGEHVRSGDVTRHMTCDIRESIKMLLKSGISSTMRVVIHDFRVQCKDCRT